MLLIVFAILLGLAILPLGVDVSYDCDGLVLNAIVGFVPIHILPKTSKNSKQEKKTKKKSTCQKKSNKSKKTKISKSQSREKKKGGSWTDFLPLVQTGLDFLNAFRQKLRIRRLEMKLILAADDPCDLAINYGRAWAALGNLMPQLERCFVIKKRDLEVECDFESTHTVVIARANISITLGRLILILTKYGLRAVKDFMNMKKLRKGGASK